MIDFPIDSIIAEACENIHLNSLVVTTKDTGKSIFIGHNGAIENAV
jgi:hypothetical protein